MQTPIKKTAHYFIAAAIALSFCACQNQETNRKSDGLMDATTVHDTDWGAPFIPIAQADTMIKSYLTSINYESEDSNVRSFIVDANALRKYLVSNQGKDISHLKIIMAHNMNYIRGGKYGLPCAYSNDALTVILAGYGEDGNYIYAPNNKVMDFSMPCPKNCPVTGNATSDLLQTN